MSCLLLRFISRRLSLASLTLLCCSATAVSAFSQSPGDPPPASSAINDQLPGSALIFSYLTSSGADPVNTNSRVSLTNASHTSTARIRLFFVNGSDGTLVISGNEFICLTQNQTISFNIIDTFPGVTGWLLAVAVNSTGCPISFNHLTGEASVKLASGHRASYHAEAIPALYNGTLPGCDNLSISATLSFDGVSYQRLPRALALDKIRSPGNNNSTLLALSRIGGNLTANAANIGAVSGTLFDSSGNGASFNFTQNTPQLVSELSDAFPVTTPLFSALLPAGDGGWMKLYADDDSGLLGVLLNFNPNAATSTSAFTGGRNLHKLTTAASVSLTIPLALPPC